MMLLTKKLRKYNLDVASLDQLDSGLGSGGITDEVLSQDSMDTWKKQLIYILAKHNGCVAMAYDNQSRETIDAAGFFVVAGEPQNIAVVRELYSWLSKELPRWAYDAWVEAKTAPLPESTGGSWEYESFGPFQAATRRMSQDWVDWELARENPMEWRRSYIIGVIWGWNKKMELEARTASMQDASVSSLMVIQNREVRQYVDEKFQTEYVPVRAKAMAHSAYRMGEERGGKIATEKQVGGDGTLPQIGN